MKLFDTHCHVDGPQFDQDREAVHARMAEYGVSRFAVIGTDLTSSRQAVRYAAAHPGAVAAVGFHPESARECTPEALEEIAALFAEPCVRAIGEIGLDYHWPDNPTPEEQKAACGLQLQLARRLDVPCAFHVRDAHQDMVDLLKAHRGILTGGIMHCFSGSWEIAKEYLKLGYYISFAGPVTFKKAPRLQEAALNVPRDRLLIETDSPYMAPEPVRGRRNEPANVRFVCEKIAQLRGMDAEELARITTENALRVYRVEA